MNQEIITLILIVIVFIASFFMGFAYHSSMESQGCIKICNKFIKENYGDITLFEMPINFTDFYNQSIT